MEGGAEVSCKVIRAEALSCCREHFLEFRKGTDPRLFMESLYFMVQNRFDRRSKFDGVLQVKRT